MSELIKAYSLKIGERKKEKRIWIESQKIRETEMSLNMRYDIEYDVENRRITLTPGNDKVLTERKGNDRIVVDINNKLITQMFKGVEHISTRIYKDSIVIEPLKEEMHQEIAKAKAYSKVPTFIEIFAGGGTLIRSLRDSGLSPVAAIELEDKYLENSEANNPGMFTYCGDLAKLDISLLPKADVVSAGIPCEGYSPNQLGENRAESHPTGSLGFYVLKIIDIIRPAVVLIEEVPNFKNSAMAAMVRYVLSSMGYHISEKDLKAPDYGTITKRKRYCMVASIKAPFEFSDEVTPNLKCVQDILEIPVDERTWLTKDNNKTIRYSLEKEQEHIRKKEGFRFARTYIEDTVTATVTKGYYQGRLTDPILIHPGDSNKYSWFTPLELKRINGLPEDFILPVGKGISGQIIGQGVAYPVFKSIGEQILNHFRDESIKCVTRDESLKDEFANNENYEVDQLATFKTGSLF